MYKVLPTMRRLAAEIVEAFELDVCETVAETECALTEGVQSPYLIFKLRPHARGGAYLSIRPLAAGGFSKSFNNCYAVMIPAQGAAEVVPSWRGHIVPWRDLGKERYRYYIEAGYLPITAPRDFVEERLINEYERRAG